MWPRFELSKKGFEAEPKSREFSSEKMWHGNFLVECFNMHLNILFCCKVNSVWYKNARPKTGVIKVVEIYRVQHFIPTQECIMTIDGSVKLTQQQLWDWVFKSFSSSDSSHSVHVIQEGVPDEACSFIILVYRIYHSKGEIISCSKQQCCIQLARNHAF